MQMVCGRVGRKTVHDTAPPSANVTSEMNPFLGWLDSDAEPNRLVKAALAHRWFETIHPFEDGNGRIGRAIVDPETARESGEPARMLRISQQLLERRGKHCQQLGLAEHGALDVTPWVVWFVEQVRRWHGRFHRWDEHPQVREPRRRGAHHRLAGLDGIERVEASTAVEFLLPIPTELAMHVTEKGQVTIPKHIRDAAGVAPGSEVAFSLEGSRIVITPVGTSVKDDRRAALRAAAARVHASQKPEFQQLGADEIMRFLRGDEAAPTPVRRGRR